MSSRGSIDDGCGGNGEDASTRLLPRLLPALGGHGSRRPSIRLSSAPPKRIGNPIACRPCKARKLRCDGIRPVCTRCQKKNTGGCQYELPAGVSRQVALKNFNNALKRDNADLRELVLLLKTNSEAEAKAILNMIRSHDDPLIVIKKLRQLDLLLTSPDTPSQDSDEADVKSAIQVPARPWTSVATDEVVSELITAWFAWEDTTLFSYITLDLFVADMKAGDPESATYCSPFLVNAICAAKASMDKPAADAASESTWKLSERFLAAAKEHLELQCGRASLPTIHGLYCLFQHASISGEDRAGTLYRLAAIDMISRLNLTKVYRSLRDDVPSHFRRKQAISRTLWAVCNVESLTTSLYLKPTLFPAPPIPPYFREPPLTSSKMEDEAFDFLGSPFSHKSSQPPVVRGAQYALCEVSIIMNEVVNYNHTTRECPSGGAADIDIRQGLYRRLTDLERSWPSWLRHDAEVTPQTFVLGFFANIVAYNILRPLYNVHPDTSFEPSLPPGSMRGPLGYASTAQSFILKHAAIDVNLMETLEKRWPYNIHPFTSLFLAAPYNCAATLISLLHIPVAQNLFTRAVRNLRLLESGLPCVKLILGGLLVVARSVGQQIPSEAQDIFEGVEEACELERKDIPVSFRAPQDEALVKLLAISESENLDMVGEVENMGSELGCMLSLYKSMSLKGRDGAK
ncbi:hypothetical protein EJ05DRAFT_538168 [Pseudovirgaria hyperparasitica]|uniref:Zn(2)-C6 fungal-type domain-containing protein n=1 Tax=Pseudovirgaria hyperparasitica TaxID=470096 RepID=A0A6A6W9V7_9PEZI|nr:uncharacterized protein EJ05DRAFT_538168 [Pseudovirgaria hyperparasitica]KAF2757881.1 hypothetical protein EJ05DRAFT_538168 [Pseudovirgaria hyperparasitica]